jgi:hypothetical protein
MSLLIAGLAMGGASLISGLLQGGAQRRAAKAQSKAAMAGIAEQRRQFDAVQALLNPYVQAGTSALSAQQDMLGVNGPEAQQAAIAGLQNSPEMQALVKQGETGILQNAAATGGLRGGNTQSALATFRPQMLSNLINQQYARLGGLSSAGLSAAGGLGSAGQNAGNQITALLGQQGQAQASGAFGNAQMWNAIPNALATGIGTFAGLGGKF